VEFFLSVILISWFAGNAVAQCPVLPRHASIDPNGKTVVIRYYNSGSRAVQAVEFTVQRPQAGQNESAVLARFSAREILHPKVEKIAVFQRPSGKSDLIEAAQVDALEVQVTRVVFTDQSMWKPSRENTCKVSFSLR
jgi:hypothetical protein